MPFSLRNKIWSVFSLACIPFITSLLEQYSVSLLDIILIFLERGKIIKILIVISPQLVKSWNFLELLLRLLFIPVFLSLLLLAVTLLDFLCHQHALISEVRLIEKRDWLPELLAFTSLFVLFNIFDYQVIIVESSNSSCTLEGFSLCLNLIITFFLELLFLHFFLSPFQWPSIVLCFVLPVDKLDLLYRRPYHQA
jgi:hypothetical protein